MKLHTKLRKKRVSIKNQSQSKNAKNGREKKQEKKKRQTRQKRKATPILGCPIKAHAPVDIS